MHKSFLLPMNLIGFGSFGSRNKEPMMTIDMTAGTVRLNQLLTEALALADALGHSIVAIHIAEALDQTPSVGPAGH